MGKIGGGDGVCGVTCENLNKHAQKRSLLWLGTVATLTIIREGNQARKNISNSFFFHFIRISTSIRNSNIRYNLGTKSTQSDQGQGSERPATIAAGKIFAVSRRLRKVSLFSARCDNANVKQNVRKVGISEKFGI